MSVAAAMLGLMVEEEQDLSCAVTAGPEHGDRGLRDGLAWLTARARQDGGHALVFAPSKGAIRDSLLLNQFIKRIHVAVGTWRRNDEWSGGPVLAAWPDRVKLGEIADDGRTTALCVVPWNPEETEAWQAASDPELLGPAVASTFQPDLDPVVVEGLKTMTVMVNHANHLAGPLDRRDAVDPRFSAFHRIASFSGREESDIFAANDLEGSERVVHFGKVDSLGSAACHCIGFSCSDLARREGSQRLTHPQTHRGSCLAKT
jgi:hypothetical protein